mmetsp:Transcript_36465/g.113654  ORF Transcript_36465/g.113654 Transcript_36465/m.113654 type:complete len:488 (+) Transcript_36465:121-1584(+)
MTGLLAIEGEKLGPTVLGSEQPGMKPAESEEKVMEPNITGQIAYRIRWVLALVALGTVASHLAGPSVQFIMTSFFAQDYNGGDCEEHPKSEPCRRGAADLAFYNGVSNGLSHAVAWAAAMVLGSWSDAVGRRPFIRAKAVFGVAPAIALCLHVFWGCTLWVYLVVTPMFYAFDNVAVFLACMNDLITEPHLRSGSFGVLMGFFIAMAGLTLPLGGLLPVTAAVAASLAVTLVHVAYAFTCFPETLPESVNKKSPPGICAIMRLSVEIFGRNTFILRMVVVLVLSGFGSAGLGTLLPSYMMAYLGFNRKLGAVLVFLCGVSVALSLTFLLAPLLHRYGEVTTMKISLACGVIYPVLIPLCENVVQFTVLTFIFVGPCALQFPVISSIKSNLVGEDEQGIVQGALAAVRVLAVAISDPLFGFIYRLSTDNGARESRFSALVPILCVVSLLALACFVAQGLPPQPPPRTKRVPSCPEEIELVSTAGNSGI